MYKLLFFLFMLFSGFLFFSWVLNDRYFQVYVNEGYGVKDNYSELQEKKRILSLWQVNVFNENGDLSDLTVKQLDKAVELYQAGLCEKILISGDKDNATSNEVVAMMDYLINKDIPQENILADFYSPGVYSWLYRLQNVYSLTDFYLLTDSFTALEWYYVADRLAFESTVLIYEERELSWFTKVLTEWKVFFQTKIFSPDVYVDDKNPNYFLEHRPF